MHLMHIWYGVNILGLVAISISAGARQTSPPSEWVGLSGGDLSAMVARNSIPTNYVTQFVGPTGFYEIFKITDGNDERGCYNNYFSSSIICYGIDGGAPDNFELLAIISPHWWNALTTNYTSVSHDLYNLIPSPEGISSLKGDEPPGIVGKEESLSIPGLKWKYGVGTVGTSELRLWEPPDELKGDVARCLMYVATIYPNGVRRYESGGGEVWAEDIEDVFMPAYAAQLLVWHRSDPPSIAEFNRNHVFSQIQGNRNPFVDFPDLAEFLWGIKKGECYVENEDNTSFSSSDESIPLKAIYSLAESRINLYSPSIPDDAEWIVDGTPVTNSYLVPQELGIGLHTLRFISKTWTGMLRIEIK